MSNMKRYLEDMFTDTDYDRIEEVSVKVEDFVFKLTGNYGCAETCAEAVRETIALEIEEEHRSLAAHNRYSR